MIMTGQGAKGKGRARSVRREGPGSENKRDTALNHDAFDSCNNLDPKVSAAASLTEEGRTLLPRDSLFGGSEAD